MTGFIETSKISCSSDGPHEITIQPYRSVFYVGEFVTCTTDANPPAIVIWRDITGNNQSGAKLDFDESLRCIENCSYECIATNKYGSKRASISFSLKPLERMYQTVVMFS